MNSAIYTTSAYSYQFAQTSQFSQLFLIEQLVLLILNLLVLSICLYMFSYLTFP